MTWWIRLFVLSIVVLAIVDAPRWLGWLIMLSLFALAMVRSPADDDREPVVVAAPVRGRWVALNSPASRVPSHGIRAYGQSHAIDILHPRPPGSGRRVGWGLGMRPPAVFSSFGQPVLAVADGVVVRASDRQRDHRSRESWASLAYLFVVEGFFREVAGPPFILGNHLVVDHGDGSYSTYAHLRRGSLRVSAGDEVHTGQQLAEVGNSGNTTEPHLHLQVMDDPRVTAAAGVPFRWSDVEIAPGDADPSRSAGPVSTAIEPGLPANGQVFAVASDTDPRSHDRSRPD